MSRENVEIVRREYAAFAARDWAALAEIWHPDIEYVAPGAGTFRGVEQVTGFFDSYSDLYSDFRVEAVEIMDAGNQVVAVERLSGRGLMGSEMGTWVHDMFARLITFKDGKIWRAKEYPTLAEARKAADLQE